MPFWITQCFKKIFDLDPLFSFKTRQLIFYLKSDLNAANLAVEKEIEKTKQANADREKANSQVANLERQVRLITKVYL